MSEEILGSIELYQKMLYFTPNRVIVAKTGGSAGFLFGGIGAAAEAYRDKKKKEKLKQLSAESILTADKKNFAVPYSNIINVEMKKPGRFRAATIHITTDEKTHKFTLTQKKEFFDGSLNLVRSVLLDKVVLKQ